VKNTGVEFSTRLLTELKPDIRAMQDEWQLFVAECEYGYDVARESLEVIGTKPLAAEGATVEIQVDHGWQSAGIAMDAGKTYRIAAGGRYQLAKEPKVWWCEPGGVTIRYYRGRPLGMLLGAVRNDVDPQGVTPLLSPAAIGLSAEFTPKEAGTLWLKVNEHPAQWGDNAGSLRVTIVGR
jgi:hypothetical protein